MGRSFLIPVFSLSLLFAACTINREPLGSEGNPIKLYFVPSVDAKVIESNATVLKKFLEKNTPYKYNILIPQSFITVVESFRTKKADVSAINSYGYVMAHDKYGVEARLTVIRHGSATYQSQFITHKDSSIKSLKDLNGKKIAFVDPSSASGYLLPLKTLNDHKIVPKETVFAMKHDAVISMIYQKQVDAGATYYSPPSENGIEDARRLVKTQYPDVEEKIKIIELSEPIPNDPIVFRKEMPEEMKEKIVEAFLLFVSTDDGKKVFKEIYGATNLKRATDADYDSVRKMLMTLGRSAQDLIKK